MGLVRRVAPVTALALSALAGSAPAAINNSNSNVTNTVAYSVTVALSNAPSAAAPANLAYRWTEHVDTNPPGAQPATSPAHTIFLAKGIRTNGRYYPSCAQAQIDGQATMSQACDDAIVGAGSATLYAGSPGSPRSNSVKEDVSVTLVNGAKATPGDQLLMVLRSAPGAPVSITNRVVPGTIAASTDPYALAIRFDIPPDLQKQLGLSIALTDLDVTISGTSRRITAGAATFSTSYLQMTDCQDSLPARLVTTFLDSHGALSDMTTEGTAPCAIGSFPDDPSIATGPIRSNAAPPPPGEQILIPPPGISLAAHPGTARAARNGAFVLAGVRVTCPATATGPCQVTGTAGPLARAQFRLAPGQSSTVQMRLTKLGKRVVAKKRSTKLGVRLAITQPGGPDAAKSFRAFVAPLKPPRG